MRNQRLKQKQKMSNNNIEMGSGGSKNEEINTIKEVEEMDENEMSSKDKLFKKAIIELYEELKKVKNQKKDKIFYKLPAITLCQQSLF